MKRFSLAMHCLVWCLIGLYPNHLWAAAPNIVLSRALHFSAPDGTSVKLGPGKYYIEQFGTSELRLTPEGDKPTVTIRAESLTHEQYELFSAMALTRPQKNDEFLIELLLPGGIRLEARGSTKAPPDPPKIATTPTPAAAPPHGSGRGSPDNRHNACSHLTPNSPGRQRNFCTTIPRNPQASRTPCPIMLPTCPLRPPGSW